MTLAIVPCKQRFYGRPMFRRANKLLIRPLEHRATKKSLLAGYGYRSP